MPDVEVYIWESPPGPERGVDRRVVVPDFSGGPDRPITIGSDPGCHVVLSGPGVAALHARVYWLGIHRFLEALADGTCVRGGMLPVGGKVRVDWHAFQVAGYTLAVPDIY
jgi:hypothetical protein